MKRIRHLRVIGSRSYRCLCLAAEHIECTLHTGIVVYVEGSSGAAVQNKQGHIHLYLAYGRNQNHTPMNKTFSVYQKSAFAIYSNVFHVRSTKLLATILEGKPIYTYNGHNKYCQQYPFLTIGSLFCEQRLKYAGLKQTFSSLITCL